MTELDSLLFWLYELEIPHTVHRDGGDCITSVTAEGFILPFSVDAEYEGDDKS